MKDYPGVEGLPRPAIEPIQEYIFLSTST